mgnify:CR=1 FL=1
MSSPNVNFIFENNNLAPAVPSKGITNVLAVTTKGKFNEPTLCENFAKFKSIFGKELVPDGTISNIERAFKLGSTLRVCRVAGGGSLAYGEAKSYVPSTGVTGGSAMNLSIFLEDPTGGSKKIEIKYKITTKEQGSNVVSEFGYNLNRNFFLELKEVITTGIARVYITQFKAFTAENVIDTNTIINQSLLLTSTASVVSGVDTMVDPNSIIVFLQNTPNITLTFVSITSTGTGVPNYSATVTNTEQSIDVIKENKNWLGYVKVGGVSLDTPNYNVINEGTNGGASTSATWLAAFNAIKGEDAYHLICSHMHQYITTDYTTTCKTIAEDVASTFDTELFIEIPKTNFNGTYKTAAETKSALDTMKATIGYHKNVAYFGGGIKLYNSDGILKYCDVLGTVIGLADVSAKDYGPYYSFANVNRGLVNDGQGPIIENLANPAMVNTLNGFADSRINIFVVKDTDSGKKTVMWHNLTSTNMNTSDRFLSVIGLQLYLKKTLKPKLEKYLEEPNTFSTWKDIYLTNKKTFDDLIGVAITEYQWYGDQDAKNYTQLTINNEADVRQGKYVIKVSYKEIVTMQQIDIYLTINTANNTVSIN